MVAAVISFGMIVPGVRVFGAENSGGIAALGIDVKALVLQILTFVFVFWLLKRFALKSIVATLEKRRQTIDKGVALGLEMQQKQKQLDEHVQQILHQARGEADKIIAAAHNQSAQLLKDSEAAAAKKTADMLTAAENRIKEDIERARRDLEKDVLALVAEATEALIHEKLTPQKDMELVRQVLKRTKVVANE